MYTSNLAHFAVVASTLIAGTLAKPGFRGCNLNPTLNVDDARALSAQFANDFSTLEVKASHTWVYKHGSSSICIYNGYLFDNTHVVKRDFSIAINTILANCGSKGGRFTVQGDTGLQVDVFLHGANDSC
ncbi:hypothetical protein J3F84DRAFT_386167 [Trichoderma pleuroticola]